MTKRYYSIRFERTDELHRSGEQVLNADNPLYIGQTASCDVRLDNPSQYEDAKLAVIEKRSDGKGWKLVRLSPYKEHEISVNGTPIDYVHFLNDGDHIAFEGQRQEMSFNIREDDLYTTGGIINIGRNTNRPMMVWLAIISLGLLGFLLSQLYTRPMSAAMIDNAKQSVYQIKVDSIQLTVNRGDSTTTLRTAYLHNVAGTASLTTNGQLVPARHCLEPWLAVAADIPMDTTERSKTPLHVRMALQAVTNNIVAESMDDDTRWEMVSYCSLRKPELSDTVLVNLTSKDFIMDKSRDLIMEYGDYDHQYFWRNIKATSSKTDMMLGDIAFMADASERLHTKGTIPLASKKEMRKLCRKTNRYLNILGRTDNQTSKEIEWLEAKLKVSLTKKHYKDGYPNVDITHDGNVSRGFSGGPVMTRHGMFGWCAVGVVSVTDSKNGNWFYSVPTTEIERMNN